MPRKTTSFLPTAMFALAALLFTFCVGPAAAQVLIDTLPANNQANLTADAAQTFTIQTLGTPRLSNIAIEGPQAGANDLGPFVLEFYTDTDGDHGTWDPAALVSSSTSGSLVSGGATTTTFNFNDTPALTPGAVYGFTYTDGGGTRINARTGLTNANAITHGTLFSAGGQVFGDAFDTAMQVNITNDSHVIDHVNLPNLETAGSQATFEYQTFTPSVGGLGTTDNTAAMSPLDSFVNLDSAAFVRAPLGTATAGDIFLDVYEGGAGDAGTYLGSSINSNDINAAAGLEFLVWDFDDIILDSDLEYSLVFSSDDGEGNTVLGRVAAANNGGGFVDTYAGGLALGSIGAVPFDTRFAVSTSSVVPEPASIALWTVIGMGLAGFGYLRRRRKS